MGTTTDPAINTNISGATKQINDFALSVFNAADMRYMLLHELQHYRHKDALSGFLMNLTSVLYWCNPLVWLALKEMRNDREIACDTSVLKLLHESDYEDYGNTLINFAEKISHAPFPFSSGISGSMKQMQQRITNISSYTKPSICKKLKGLIAFAVISIILLGFTPMLSTLKISPVEQVELLRDLYHNNFDFTPENINAVKDSICLFSSENFSSGNKSFYGKTGTGRVDGQDVNGWFVGYLETNSNTYFFATNIQSDTNASGSRAAEITQAVLSALDLWQ